MRIFVIAATYELRLSRKRHLRDHQEEEEVEGIEEDRSLKSLLSLAKQELEEEASIKQVFIQTVNLFTKFHLCDLPS